MVYEEFRPYGWRPVLETIEQKFLGKPFAKMRTASWAESLCPPFAACKITPEEEVKILSLLLKPQQVYYLVTRQGSTTRIAEADLKGVLYVLFQGGNRRYYDSADTEYYIVHKKYDFLLGRSPEGKMIVRGEIEYQAASVWQGFRRVTGAGGEPGRDTFV